MPNSVEFDLYLITDRHQVLDGLTLPQVIALALEAGVKAIQLREKDLPASKLLPLARELRFLTLNYGAKLLINDRVDVALATDADGVHLGGHSMPTAEVRELLGPDRLIGVSTHSLKEISNAAFAGADFVTFGPVYATDSKRSYGPPLGPDALAAACQKSPLPVFGLGGITPERQAEVMRLGAAGVALISAICGARHPADAARRFLA